MATVIPTEIATQPVPNPASVSGLELGLVILFSVLMTSLIFFVVRIVIDLRHARYH